MTDAVDQRVSFDLPGPEYEKVTWIHNEHGPSSSAPLSRTVCVPMDAPDFDDGLPNQISVNGYGYSRAHSWPLTSTLSAHLQDGALPEDDSNLLDWRERCLPLVDAAVTELDDFDPHSVKAGDWKEVIGIQQTRISEASRLVHSTAVFHAQMFAETFAARYTEEFGEDKQAVGLALLQGFPNVSTDRAVDLWDLGRIARRSPSVMSAIACGTLPSGDDKVEVEFRDAFASAMDKYGHINPLGAEDLPIWREDMSMPISIIRQYATEDEERDPRLGEQAAVARRRELETALSEAARSSDGAAELVKLLPYGQHIGPVTEDHNLLADQRLTDASRQRWLRVGEMLRERGAVDQSDDVFYYEFGELLELLESDDSIGADVIATRREQLSKWRTVIPPAVLGKGAFVEEVVAEEIVVTGMAAAAGSYNGRARVIQTLAEAGKLEEGDVLVCDLTTPSWTPYFAVIGAVVTNIGSTLAHGAIVAREFGIPAVVATGNGTSVIPDGATVTVNGTAGTVTVEWAERRIRNGGSGIRRTPPHLSCT